MKIFFKVLTSLLIIILLTVIIVGIVAWSNGLTIIEQIKSWLGIVSENPPIVDPNKKLSL